MQITLSGRASWVLCADQAQVNALRARFNTNRVEPENGSFSVQVMTNADRDREALARFVEAQNRSVVRQPTTLRATSAVDAARAVADRYVPRTATVAPACRCRRCGETSPGRFTTLPVSAGICDDCV